MKSEMKDKLRKLKSDISMWEDDRLDELLKQSAFDKEEIARTMYYAENSPVSVSRTEYTHNQTGNMNKVMLDIVEGFDRFMDKIRDEQDIESKRKKEAASLLKTIMILPLPYSQILYLRYYRCMGWKDASFMVNMAKSTFFRNQERAIEMLEDIYARKEEDPK